MIIGTVWYIVYSAQRVSNCNHWTGLDYWTIIAMPNKCIQQKNVELYTALPWHTNCSGPSTFAVLNSFNPLYTEFHFLEVFLKL